MKESVGTFDKQWRYIKRFSRVISGILKIHSDNDTNAEKDMKKSPN